MNARSGLGTMGVRVPEGGKLIIIKFNFSDTYITSQLLANYI